MVEVGGCQRGTACVTPATAKGLATARPVPGALDSKAILSLRASEVPIKPAAVGSGIRTTGRLPRCFTPASCSCGGSGRSCGGSGATAAEGGRKEPWSTDSASEWLREAVS